MKILMTGATGLIGQELGLELAKRGHKLVIVSRSRRKALVQAPFPCEVIEGDLTRGPLKNLLLKDVDGVVHLLGEGVAEKRWSQDQKRKILDSRVLSTRNLIASLSKPPSVFISASAIGYYGDRGEEILTEESTSGSGFLPEVCIEWEKEVDKVASLGAVRVVKSRIGIVLALNGGALAEMLPPFQAGVGGALGSGRQWMSWIHLQDIVGLFAYAIENPKVEGVVNLVAPQPERNSEFSSKLAQVLHRFKAPNVPKFVLKAMFGELSNVLLSSQNVSSEKAKKLGYDFKFENLEEAFKDILEAQSKGEEVFIAKQFIAKKKEEIFPFFSDAGNLEEITPEILSFKVTEVSTPKIQEGTLINYKLKIHGIPIRWQTHIDEWNPPVKFVDTALKGPYSLWHHTHTFEDLGEGTLMVDRIRYALPVGYLGWIVANWTVKKDIQKIFEFRRQKISEIFDRT